MQYQYYFYSVLLLLDLHANINFMVVKHQLFSILIISTINFFLGILYFYLQIIRILICELDTEDIYDVLVS